MSSDRRLVLASASPARLSLLRQAGLAPEVVVSHVDESSVRAPRVAEQVALLAAAKAAEVAKQENDALVIGADSLLEFHGKPLGKPADAAEARDRWQRMAGRSGVLHTGQALFDVQEGAVVGRDIAVDLDGRLLRQPDAAGARGLRRHRRADGRGRRVHPRRPGGAVRPPRGGRPRRESPLRRASTVFGQRLPSIIAEPGVMCRPSTARCMASMVA